MTETNRIEYKEKLIKERIEKRLWDGVALREAIINAMVHNDYTMEVAPTVEIFSDRITVTSAGSLPNNLTEQDFFEGLSIPRNKELMRIFKDLELVEQLGSGVPRILQSYDKSCFRFMDNFLRMSFPFNDEVIKILAETEYVTEYVTEQVEKLVLLMNNESFHRDDLMGKVEVKHKEYFRSSYLQPALELKLIEMTIPDKPRSKNQKYRLTDLGKKVKQQIMNNKQQIKQNEQKISK